MAKAKTKKQDDTLVKFRVAMMHHMHPQSLRANILLQGLLETDVC